MQNRRAFLKHLAYAGTGSLVFSQIPFSAAQSPRREVYIDGRRVKVVDIHAHVGFRAVDDVVRGSPINYTESDNRIFGQHWIDEIDRRGIDIQVISINRYWWYEADEDLARRITRVQDQGLAEWCARHPDRFVGLSSVALQHPELAAEQLEYAVKELGLRGASIGGHVMGEVPSSTRFDPFWAKVEELDVPIFMHPDNAKNIDTTGVLQQDDFGGLIGNPLETTLFLTGLMFDGTLDRFPGIKVCAAHGGGYLPSYLGRTEVTCERRDDDPDTMCAKKLPSEYMKTQILADSMVFNEEGLRHLVEVMGPSQVVYGTDLPFNWPDTLDLILNATFLTKQEKEAIVGGNLIELLRIT
jgi:aminocarboxymuconate-semialdehyde decarboxylase